MSITSGYDVYEARVRHGTEDHVPRRLSNNVQSLINRLKLYIQMYKMVGCTQLRYHFLPLICMILACVPISGTTSLMGKSAAAPVRPTYRTIRENTTIALATNYDTTSVSDVFTAPLSNSNFDYTANASYGLGQAICYDLPTGDISITLHTGNCFHGISYGENEMGWPSSNGNGATRFIVEEVNLDTKYSAGA